MTPKEAQYGLALVIAMALHEHRVHADTAVPHVEKDEWWCCAQAIAAVVTELDLEPVRSADVRWDPHDLDWSPIQVYSGYLPGGRSDVVAPDDPRDLVDDADAATSASEAADGE